MSPLPLIGLLTTALLVGASALAAPAKKPARPAARTPSTAPAAKAPEAQAPMAELAPGQLDAAGRVLTGQIPCEFDQTVRITAIDGKPGYFKLDFKKASYTLVPQETTTGAVRLEDRQAGVVWLQISAKSMLLNARTGNRMVDSCLHDEQRFAAVPPDSALGIAETPPAASGSTAVVTAAALAPAPAPAEPLMPRQVLFGNPQRAGGSISPDGQWLAWLAPKEGVLNVWVAPVAAPDQSRTVTDDRLRGIRGFAFARDGKHLLYAQDEGGDENFQVFAVELAGGAARALSPRGSRAGITGLSDKRSNEVLLSVNDRDPRYFDLVRVDLASGKSTRVLENKEFAEVVTDADFRPRYASRQRADGGDDWFLREGESWQPWSTVPQEDALTTAIAGISTDGRTLYLQDSRGRDTGALYAIDTRTGARRPLHEDVRADVGDVLVHPVTGIVQAASSNYLRRRWVAIDAAIAPDLLRLETLAAGGEFAVTARTRDDNTWVVSVTRSDASGKTYLYDRASGTARLWYDSRPALAGLPLAPMHTLEIGTRDGLVMPSYLSLPKGTDADGDGKPEQALPMVLLVHGGPWARDDYGLNGTHQWLANRGYAVLSVNFRGSTGFGKSFTNAGDLQWGRKMHDDLLDAVEWAAKNGVARRDKVAIMGGSYGGYAALAGLTMTPKDFACAVSIVGPSNLVTLLDTIPAYWGPLRKTFSSRVGDPDTPEGRQLLVERSPLTYVDRIERPLLIGQGANDPRVKRAESDQIVAAMQARRIPVTYVIYPDEGHGFARPPNRISFNAVAEQFLAGCLGGRVEAVGADFQGASIQLAAGAEGMPAVKASLPPPPTR